MENKLYKMKTFEEVKKEWLKDPEFKKQYEALKLQRSFMKLLVEQRQKKGLTQKELAEKIGTKQSSIARFESGAYNPTLLFVKRLADALGVEITVKV